MARLLTAALLVCVFASAQQADLIVHNGKIVTVDSRFAIARAMAVRGESILAVGGEAEVMRHKGASTRVIDLKGKTVLPGLMDSHTHAADAAMYEFDHEVPDMETVADVLAYIRARAKVVPDGQWITLSQVFITRLREQRYPTRAELDEAAGNHPVAFRTGPDASLNTLALKASGIDRNTKAPPGAKIELDPATGEPTGILRSAGSLIKSVSSGRTATLDDRANRLAMLIADYNTVGITSIADRDSSDQDVAVYERLHETGRLNCRVFINYSIDPNAPIEKVRERILQAARHPLHKPNNRLWMRGLKAYLDGGMLTGSAYMREPWGVSRIYSIIDPNYRGMLYIQPDRLADVVRMALQNDLQFTAHSVGDGAVTNLVAAYERVNREFPVRDQRPCVTHCNFMTPEAIEKMAALGVVADLQPAWLERDGATLTKQFGDARLRFFQPYATLARQGVTAGGGSDHMQKIGGMRSINPYNPFFGMWITLTRQPRWTDKPLHPEERLTREQAIRLYTVNNAFLTFAEKERGSLEPGKLADFIVLDRDILTCPLDQVKQIQVTQTFLGGRQVHPPAK